MQKQIKRIKTYPDNNQYTKTNHGIWVRNFVNIHVPPKDINTTYSRQEIQTFLANEIQNSIQRFTWLENENFQHQTIVIVSDGYDFSKKQKLLSSVPKDVGIIGVLGSFQKWNVPGRLMDYYLVNNPFPQCMKYLNKKTRMIPKCIASLRTNPYFLHAYKGQVFKYMPVHESNYTSKFSKETKQHIDDYRNPICAAIHCAYIFGASKIILFCCDDSFSGERPGSEKLENGLYQYPQQRIAHELIDNKMFWLHNEEYSITEAFHHDSGSSFENATYISEEELPGIFN